MEMDIICISCAENIFPVCCAFKKAGTNNMCTKDYLCESADAVFNKKFQIKQSETHETAVSVCF
jgi:hypothetical protein